MTYRLILSIPTGSSVEALTDAQRAVIKFVHGRWTEGGMPGTTPTADRYLIDALADQHVDRAKLDEIGLWQWLIVGCWAWDGEAPTGSVVEPLDGVLLLPHCPDGVLPHHWGGWDWCA